MAYKLEFDYAHVPTVERFADSDKFIRGLVGPFGSGKSTGCVMEIIQRAKAQKPSPDGIRRSRWAVIRNTYPQLRDTTIKTFQDWFPPKYFGKWKAMEHDYIITGIKDCYIEVLFRALDRPDQVSNLLSLELTGAWINEAREIPRAIFEALQGRVGRYPAVKDGGCSWSGIFMDTNPPDMDGWWYKLFEETKPDNCEVFKQPSGLGPNAENKHNLPANYYENLAMGKDPEFVKVYVHGEYGFIVDGKPVYPEYKDHVHCQKVKALEGVTIYRGWDFGLTPACIFTQVNPKNGQWLLIDEMTADNMGIDRFSGRVRTYSAQKYPNHRFEDFGDPAGAQRAQTDEKTCFQIMRAKGINIEAGHQDPNLRIESVKKPLNTMIEGEPGILVDPKCKMARKGFQGGYQYRRMQTNQERFSDKPDKNQYSHIHDAIQYVATRLFGHVLETPVRREQPRKRYSGWKSIMDNRWMSA